MAEAFEYAVRKDVRNNPIVREVDVERQTEMWKTLGLAVFLVVAIMFWTWQHFELVRHGYRLDEVQRAQAAFAAGTYMIVVNGKPAEALNQTVSLPFDSKVTFLRLTPLTGG